MSVIDRVRPALALVLSLCACSSSEPGVEPSSGGSANGGSGGAGSAGVAQSGGASAGGAANAGSAGATVAGGGAGGSSSGNAGTAGSAGSAAGTAGETNAVGGATSGGAGAGGGAASGGGGSAGAAGGATGGGGAAAGMSGSGGSAPTGSCDATATVAAMKLGWNLGNSLDALDAAHPDTTVETAWGNPIITPALLGAVAAAGFGAVRIPVTWVGRFGAGPEYPLSATFLNRVEEVVQYALDEDLYVIINVHHDGAEGVTGEWISLVDDSGQVNAGHTAAVLAQFRTIWTQIAARFATYDERLIFEGMNEIKVGYDTPLPAYLDQVNGLNQAFVDTIRQSGGNNPDRCLVVPGYNTNIDHTVAGFEKPTDDAPGKLILSDHYYDPWSFAGEASTQTWGTGSPGIDDWGQEDWVRTQVGKLKTNFIDQGLPVILGEYGAVQQDGYENYRRYYFEYVTKAAHDAGIVVFVWDNGALAPGAEGFGLFNRSNNTLEHPEIVDALLRAVTSDYTLDEVAKP
jgi:endoglucanase